MMGLKMMGAIAFSRGNGLSFMLKRAIHQNPIPRLRREDIRYIVHDSFFSPWKILTGPNDWKDYSTGKEGAERYRTQNLPNNNCPGDYELGVLAPSPFIRKVDPSLVIPAYLGQTDDIRSRLQSYGRDGAHLEKALFFSDIFSMNFSIVYRWAPTKSKEEAEEMEEKLLRKYDYAWNKKNNGDRRPQDIRARLTNKPSLLSVLQQVVLRRFHLGGKIIYQEFWRRRPFHVYYLMEPVSHGSKPGGLEL